MQIFFIQQGPSYKCSQKEISIKTGVTKIIGQTDIFDYLNVKIQLACDSKIYIKMIFITLYLITDKLFINLFLPNIKEDQKYENKNAIKNKYAWP